MHDLASQQLLNPHQQIKNIKIFTSLKEQRCLEYDCKYQISIPN